VLVFNHDGSIHYSFQIIIGHGYQIGLQLLMQSIKEPLLLLLIEIDVIGGIPSPGGELVQIPCHTHASLLQIVELVPHYLDKTRGNMGLAELGLEGIPSHHLALRLHGTDILPPCTCGSS
jgi:hypothetical protein